MKIIEEVSYFNGNGYCKLDMYLPDKTGFKTIVFFHGGGLVGGDKKGPREILFGEEFTSAGYGFVSVNYRMYPNVKFPTFLNDASKAVAFIHNNIKNYGGNGEIIVAGQSAGAWITLMLCLNEKYLLNQGVNPKNIFAWFSDSAQVTSHFNVLNKEKGLHQLTQRIDKSSPLFYVNENTSFSKMFLILYDNDMPCRYEQNKLFIENILCFNKDAKIEHILLSGTHCSSAKMLDENGKTMFSSLLIKWLNGESITK